MRSDVVPGGIFPNYELPDHTGELRKLSELQGDDPLILTLARGHYCPKEHQQHLELAAFYPKIAVAYTQIAAIARPALSSFIAECPVLASGNPLVIPLECHTHNHGAAVRSGR